MIRAVLLDFDGTLVTTDILTGLAELVGKRAESDALDRDFHTGKTKGRESLIQRINLLTGITVRQIEAYLNRYDFLSPGAAEFCAYLSSHGIRTILASGNILPVLRFYQQKLSIDDCFGSQPVMQGDTLVGISATDYPEGDFKLKPSLRILDSLHISSGEVLAVGDSPADKSRFEYAGIAVAIHPKGGIEQQADYIVTDLREIIPIIESVR